MFIINIVLTSLAARSGLIIYIAGKELPVSSFAGVLSALGNICLVFLVLFYKKRGFITSVVLLTVQFPIYAAGLITSHNLTSLPGSFSAVFTTVMLVIIYLNHTRIEREQQRIDKENLLPEKVRKKIHTVSFTFTALLVGAALFWISQLIFGIAIGFNDERKEESGKSVTMETDIGHDYCGTFFIWQTVGSNYKSVEDYKAAGEETKLTIGTPLGIANNLTATAAPVTLFLCMFLAFRKADRGRFFTGNGWRLLMTAGVVYLLKNLRSMAMNIRRLSIEHEHNAGVFAGSRYYCQAYHCLGIPALIILTALVMRQHTLKVRGGGTEGNSRLLEAATLLFGAGAGAFILLRFGTRVYEILCYQTRDAALPFYYEMLPFPRELAESPETYRDLLLFRLLKDLPVFTASALTVILLMKILFSSARGEINTPSNLKRFNISMTALAVSSLCFNLLGLIEVDMINGHFSGIYGKVTYTLGIRALCEPMLYVLILWFVKTFFSMAGASQNPSPED